MKRTFSFVSEPESLSPVERVAPRTITEGRACTELLAFSQAFQPERRGVSCAFYSRSCAQGSDAGTMVEGTTKTLSALGLSPGQRQTRVRGALTAQGDGHSSLDYLGSPYLPIVGMHAWRTSANKPVTP